MISFEDKLFTTEVVAKLEDSKLERISLLFVGVPVDGSTRVFLWSKGNSLMNNIASEIGLELEENSTNGIVGGIRADNPGERVVWKV